MRNRSLLFLYTDGGDRPFHKVGGWIVRFLMAPRSPMAYFFKYVCDFFIRGCVFIMHVTRLLICFKLLGVRFLLQMDIEFRNV